MTVLEFIRTGEPVSSGELYKKHRLSVKPATIRNELSELTEGGFLVQPHTSGGRVPTDKGYVFMVDAILGELAEAAARVTREYELLAEEFARGQLEHAVNELALELDLLGVGYNPAQKKFSKKGLNELFDELVSENEITDLRDVQEIVSDFEKLDDRISELLNFVPKGKKPKVFVGKSPITKSPHLSVIADRFSSDDGEYVVAAIGPKRMDYENNIKFFIAMKHACGEE